MKAQVKLRDKKEHKFQDVKSVYLQEGYLIIVTKLDKDTEKVEPIDLSLIDYYIINDG